MASVRRRITVLVIAEHRDDRALYVESLLAAGYMAHALASPDESEAIARGTRFDIAVIDSVLDEAALAIVEGLVGLPRRPRLVAVTSRPATGAPFEWLFDVYLLKPCTPGFLVDAVRSVQIPAPRTQDLLIIARDRIGIYDVLERFGEGAADVEIRLDLRRGERRRPSRLATFGERRRAERRALDVSYQLRSEGWAFVPAANRA